MNEESVLIPRQPLETLPVNSSVPVHLRLVRMNDSDELCKVLANGGPNMDKFQYWENGLSPDTVQAEVERSMKEIEDGNMMRYQIIHDAGQSDPIIGEVSFYDHDKITQTAHFGYWIIGGFEGKGIVSACARTLIEYAVHEWKLQRIVLGIEEGNTRSEHLATTLGARRTEEAEQQVASDNIHTLRVWEMIVDE